MSPVTVLAVDDQPVFLEAARRLVASTPGFALAGEAASGAEAITAVERLRPDLVLLDVRMPGLDGVETARRLAAAGAETVIVLVTGGDLEEVRTIAEGADAAALVGKERLSPALLRDLWARHGRPRRR